MTRIKTIGLALLAVFAFSAVAATAAQAEEAPYWSIEGTRLAAGKTFELVAKAKGNQVLTAGTTTVTCTAFSLNPGAVLLGSNAGEPGKSDETIKYTGCTVAGQGSTCAVENGTVETAPLTNELAYASNKKSLVVEFVPVTGKTLATLKFTGTCAIGLSTKVTGVAVAGAFTDAEPPVLLELPNAVASASSFLLKIVETSSTKIWLIKGGTGTEVETEELNSFGVGSHLAGTALIQLAVHGTPVSTKWSPLL